MPMRILFTAVIIAVMAVVAEQARPDVFANVPEAAGYQLVQTLNIPNSANFNAGAVPYAVNNAGLIPFGGFDRVAYYLELQQGAGPVQYAYVSMDAFTNNAAKLGIPNTASGVFRQHNVTNMNVVSNVAGVVNGTGLATGNIEFWPSNYGQTNSAAVPNASGATYDFGDGGANTAAGYGSMQIHNHDVDGAGVGTAGQTVIAYNAWGTGGNSDLGIGNQPAGNPDWTFAANAGTYSVKNLQMLVRPSAPSFSFSTNVPEAANYQVVYALDLANSATLNGAAVPYNINNAAAHADNSFSRVAYYMELQPAAGGPSQWVWTSMDTFTNDADKIGIPNTVSGAFFQKNVKNMNVFSNVASIATGTGLTTGNIEFWPSNYSGSNTALVPNASGATFDFGDGGANTSAGYGSFQVHNYDIDGAGAGTAGQTLFAYNRWGSAGGTSDLGIGNAPSGNPDWTFAQNATTYTLKNLFVLVDNTPLPPPPPSLFILPLGDSITFGSGAAGGYRTKLHNDLTAAIPTRTIDFVGSSNLNGSAGLQDLDHEGHGGYRIDQITNNLIASDGTAGNNGGFWLPGGPGGRPAIDPDIVLLHIGTNDISQGASPALAASRLDSLLTLLASQRPDAIVIVASLIPRNDALETTSAAFNALIPGLVNAHRGLGQNIFFLDMHSRLTTADLIDAVHPNQTGYNKMADAWFTAVQSVLVPEPASLCLMGIAALALGRRRRAA